MEDKLPSGLVERREAETASSDDSADEGSIGGPRSAGVDEAASVKLSDLVYVKLLNRIRAGDFALNDKLPTENDLAEQLAVSRPVVREALARLRDDGVVSSRRGSGTYVRQRVAGGPEPASPLRSIADMRRCLEFRHSLEGESAFHAAGASENVEGRRELTEAMGRLETALRNATISVDDDFGFHLAIARATGNRFFEEAMETMRPSIITGMGITPSFMPVRTPERLALLHSEHAAIYEAIMADDRDGARAAMRRHLERAIARVFEGIE